MYSACMAPHFPALLCSVYRHCSFPRCYTSHCVCPSLNCVFPTALCCAQITSVVSNNNKSKRHPLAVGPRIFSFPCPMTQGIGSCQPQAGPSYLYMRLCDAHSTVTCMYIRAGLFSFPDQRSIFGTDFAKKG